MPLPSRVLYVCLQPSHLPKSLYYLHLQTKKLLTVTYLKWLIYKTEQESELRPSHSTAGSEH